MYKITITELQEIQKILNEVIKIEGTNKEQLTKNLLKVKTKAKEISSKIDINYLKIQG